MPYIYNMTNVRRATTADIDAIRNIAEPAWRDTYVPIIGLKQVKYMLDLFYSADRLEQQISTGEQSFLILEDENQPVAFAGYSARTENADVYKLHKLYCLTSSKGKGYGRILIGAVEQAVKDAGKTILELNVNRANPAIDFYKKMGFEIAYNEDIDIGAGFWMNDYVMRKILK